MSASPSLRNRLNTVVRDIPRSGIRDIEAIHALAAQAGLEPQADHAMPSNNRLLLWRKASAFA